MPFITIPSPGRELHGTLSSIMQIACTETQKDFKGVHLDVKAHKDNPAEYIPHKEA